MPTELKRLTCICCGGQLEEKDGKLVCKYCKNTFTEVEKISEEEVVALNRATTDRNLLRFDEALEEYTLLLKKYPDNEAGNWGALLCDYGIIYEQDYNGEYIPTCHRLNERPVIESPYYAKLSAEHKENAEKIEKLRLSIADKAKKIQPYDVFICYKATEEKHGVNVPTRESKWARDIYEKLTNTYKLRVFFAEKTLAGSNIEYEPHIYSALRSSKLMFVLAGSIEHVNSTWVANEWKRYAKYIRDGEEKSLRVIYDNIEPYDLPKELQKAQAIDQNSDWMSAVEHSIKEFFNTKNQNGETKSPIVEKPKTAQPKNKKSLVIAFSIVLVILLGCGIFGGVYYNKSVQKANATAELIAYIPDEISDYSYYDELISEAYTSYIELSSWEKEKVNNRDKLLAVMPIYNEYKVNSLRTMAQGVSVDTVETSNSLADTVTLYKSLTVEQKALLNTDESLKFDNYDKVYRAIEGINEINEDVVNNYKNLDEVKRIYFSINPEYAALVYNYSLIDTFEEKIAFLNKLEFTETESGTYAVSVKDPYSLSGAVELPAKYNGTPITTIKASAFENCKKITSLIVPDTVTHIEAGAFKNCSALEEITLPFTGKSENANVYEAVFGYIFGFESINGGTIWKGEKDVFLNSQYGNHAEAIWQYTCCGGNIGTSSYSYVYSYYYYIPSSLRKVTITKQNVVKTATFNGCSMLTEISFTQGLEDEGECAFQNCTATINK